MPTNREGRCSLQAGVYHLPTDESLGFEAAGEYIYLLFLYKTKG